VSLYRNPAKNALDKNSLLRMILQFSPMVLLSESSSQSNKPYQLFISVVFNKKSLIQQDELGYKLF